MFYLGVSVLCSVGKICAWMVTLRFLRISCTGLSLFVNCRIIVVVFWSIDHIFLCTTYLDYSFRYLSRPTKTYRQVDMSVQIKKQNLIYINHIITLLEKIQPIKSVSNSSPYSTSELMARRYKALTSTSLLAHILTSWAFLTGSMLILQIARSPSRSNYVHFAPQSRSTAFLHSSSKFLHHWLTSCARKMDAILLKMPRSMF